MRVNMEDHTMHYLWQCVILICACFALIMLITGVTEVWNNGVNTKSILALTLGFAFLFTGIGQYLHKTNYRDSIMLFIFCIVVSAISVLVFGHGDYFFFSMLSSICCLAVYCMKRMKCYITETLKR